LASLLMLVLLLFVSLTAFGNSKAKKDIGPTRVSAREMEPTQKQQLLKESCVRASRSREPSEDARCGLAALQAIPLRKSEELPELSAVARLDLVREYDLCRLWLGRWGGKEQMQA
jgi:hypothetical protein